MLAPGLRAHPDGRARCAWAGDDPLYLAYHDREWGRPVVDDHRLFEKICLEGFQSLRGGGVTLQDQAADATSGVADGDSALRRPWYPTGDEYDVPGRRRIDFQGGSVTWNHSTRAVEVSYR